MFILNTLIFRYILPPHIKNNTAISLIHFSIEVKGIQEAFSPKTNEVLSPDGKSIGEFAYQNNRRHP